MVTSNGPRWSSGSVPFILLGLLCLFHGGDARFLRIMSETAMEVVEVIHRQLQAAPYCVASSGANDTQLQDALNWACGNGTGQGNVDCSRIQPGGPCYSDTLSTVASYAFDVYYTNQQGSADACNFNGVATTTSTDPSTASCTFPSVSGSGNSTGPIGNSTFTPPPPGIGSLTTPPFASPNNDSSAVRLHWITTFLCGLLVMVFLNSRL